MSKYQVPFSAGAHNEIDPAMLPLGALSSIENGRQPREGGIVKRRGTVSGDAEVTVTSVDIARPITGFAQFSGRDWLAAGGRVYARGIGTGDSWQEVGRTPRYLPVRQRWAQFDDTYVDTNLSDPCVAVNGEWIAHTWTRFTLSGSDIVLRITRASGEAITTLVVSSRIHPQVIAIGDQFLLAYANATTGLHARLFDPTTMTLGNEISVATALTAGDAFRVAAVSATAWVLVYRYNTTSFRIATRGVDATLTLIDDAFQAGVANIAWSRVILLYTTAAFYVVHVDGTGPIGGLCYVHIYDKVPDGGSNPTLRGSGELTSGLDNAIDIAVCERGIADDTPTGSAWLLMNTYGSATEPELRMVLLAATGGFIFVGQSLWHVRLGSRPFAATVHGLSVWLRVDNHTDPSANVYALCRLETDDQNYTVLVCQPELVPDERATIDYSEPTEVLDLGSGHMVFLGLAVLRSSPQALGTGESGRLDPLTTGAADAAVAHLFYEFEASGLVRMAEVAAAGYCFGGGGQVLASEGPVLDLGSHFAGSINVSGMEDGFFRRPEASMAATAGAGLTADELYQASVVYEYIDTDGRRVRSAPSSLLLATPTGGNCQLTVTYASGLATEREVSSVAHRTATHVYMTAGNGSVFYRVTPDDGAPAALDRSNATVDYVQTTEPDTTKEILYTLGNVIPNAPAPAHRTGVTAGGRPWAFGLFNPRIVECGKFFVPNEPATWTRHPAFRAFCPFDVTTGDEIDGTIVLLGPDGVALMSSEGPNNQGQPALVAPTIVSRIGCTRPDSVLRAPQGIFYQGARGLYLMPRGGGEPEFVGAGMMSEIVTVLSAALVYVVPEADRLPQLLAAFAYEDTAGARKLALLDPETRRWVGTDDRECTVLGTFGALLVSDHPTDATIVSDATSASLGDPVETTVTTGHIYPFGILGRGTMTRVQLLFTVRQLGLTLSCAMSIDGGPFSDPRDIIIPAATPDGLPLTIGQLHAVEWPTTVAQSSQETTSIRFRFSDLATAAGEGVVYHGCAIEGKASEGLRRTPPALKSA